MKNELETRGRPRKDNYGQMADRIREASKVVEHMPHGTTEHFILYGMNAKNFRQSIAFREVAEELAEKDIYISMFNTKVRTTVQVQKRIEE